jgi:hypothetical protein
MSDYFYNAGYDAGAVIDMNNLVAGCFPYTQVQSNRQPIPISPEPVQAPVPQEQVVVPAAESETSS